MSLRPSLDELSKLLAMRPQATIGVNSIKDLIRDPGDPITCETVGIMIRGLSDNGIKKIPEDPEKIAELYLRQLGKENKW